ncbi:MAG: FG-GAP-like repeat-containing protein [Phycisphaerales bacterium JB064]
MPTLKNIPRCCFATFALAGLAVPAMGQVPGYETRDGWPLILGPGPSVDGGMMVNMDADPELELVQVVQDRLYALNLDGTDVPGFPRVLTAGQGTFGAPAFGDIDGDGEDEVVVQTFFFGIRGNVFAINKDGSNVPGFPVSVGGPFKSPALADLDGDGDLEILVNSNSGGIAQLSALEGDGSMRAGFPVVLDAISSGGSPAVGDINGDGVPEIVVSSFYAVYAIDVDGNILTGFPYTPDDGGTIQTLNYNSAGLADLDGDGAREIVFATTNEVDPFTGRVYVLDYRGELRPGWPTTTEFSIFTPPSIADIDGDGALDIAIGDRTLTPAPEASIQVWDRDGVPLPGWPVTGVVGAVHAQIMVADVDGDGFVELLVDDNTAVTPLYGFNHDGTQIAGWPLPVGSASSFQQSPTIGDFDGDGFMDLSVSGNDLVDNQTYLFQLASDSVAYDPALAPVRTYQYNVRRDGVADTIEASPCRADIDGDGALTIFDFLAFQNAFDAGDPLADFDGDGSLTLFDFLAFQNEFDAGCE